MTRILTENYLSKRFFIAIAVFAFSLLLIVAIGAHALSTFQTYSRFSAFFIRLFEATVRLETELGSVDRATSLRTDALPDRYRSFLAAFSALRATDSADHRATNRHWAELEAKYRIDPQAEVARFGLSMDGMPAELRNIWHDRDAWGQTLEETVAEFLNLSESVVQAKGTLTPEQLRTLEAVRSFGQSRLLPAFERASQLIAERTLASANSALWLLIACAGAGTLLLAASGAFIFRPMQREVLQTQELLIRERDRARASEQTNRDFLARMSHELRTPLNGILGFADLLIASPLSALQKEQAATIKMSGQTLLELVNSILELSRIEAGPVRLKESDISLPDIISDVVTLLGPQALAKNLDLGAYVDPAVPERLIGDGGRIRQILLNLVGNALKFTESGAAAIELRHEGGSDAEGHTLHLSVSDTGIGIAKDQIELIFRRYAQIDGPMNHRSSGAGLGLSISRELVRLMGGEIGVDSTPDKGSTFWVRLRLAASRTPDAGRSEAAVPTNLTSRRFLVVDDNALNRRIFRLQLEAYGAEVECVPDGHAALAALAHAESSGSQFDVAIIDQAMPDTDGIALRRMIREEPAYAGVRLIISSAGGIAYDQQARALGFDAVCPKPMLQERLIAKIQELLQPGEQAMVGAITVLAAKPAPANAEPARGRRPRLLIAEDNPINQRLIVTALKQAHFALDVVSDGAEAVEAVERQSYDLVLMDIRMPVMSGVEATQRIRALTGPASKLPIIAMTANAMAGDREEYLAAGMDDYVAKPIDFTVLLTKIRAHLPIELAEAAAHAGDADRPGVKLRG